MDWPFTPTTLNDGLDRLMTGESYAIEYGMPNSPGGFGSYLRIRAINTPGGRKFAIKRLSRGIEGSGLYFDDEEREDLVIQLNVMLDRYHQPQSMQRRLIEKLIERDPSAAKRIREMPKPRFFELQDDPYQMVA